MPIVSAVAEIGNDGMNSAPKLIAVLITFVVLLPGEVACVLSAEHRAANVIIPEAARSLGLCPDVAGNEVAAFVKTILAFRIRKPREVAVLFAEEDVVKTYVRRRTFGVVVVVNVLIFGSGDTHLSFESAGSYGVNGFPVLIYGGFARTSVILVSAGFLELLSEILIDYFRVHNGLVSRNLIVAEVIGKTFNRRGFDIFVYLSELRSKFIKRASENVRIVSGLSRTYSSILSTREVCIRLAEEI